MTGATTTLSTDQQKQRSGRVQNRWQKEIRPLTLGDEQFRVRVLRRSWKDNHYRYESLNVTAFTEGVSWEDAGPVMTGTLSVRYVANLRFTEGDMVIFEEKDSVRSKRWRELWRMRIEDENSTASQATREFTIRSPLGWLVRSKDDWKFKKQKNGRFKDGYSAAYITRQVAKRYGFEVGHIAKPPLKLKKLIKFNTSPMDIITLAYKHANEWEGRRYVIEYRNAKLQVTPLHYSPYLYRLGPQLVEATLARTLQAGFATSVTVRGVAEKSGKKSTSGSDKNKKSKKDKIMVEVRNRKLEARFGRIHKSIKDPDADTPAKARKLGRLDLKKNAVRNKELTLTSPLIMQLRRGDAIRIRIPQLGMTRIAFVRSVSHTVTAGDSSSEITVEFDDLIKQLRICAARCEAARNHDRPEPDDCDCFLTAREKREEKRKKKSQQDSNDDASKRDEQRQ